jgi:hypothetical protein
LFSSCTDWLFIQPAGKVVLDSYWKSESDVEDVIASCYRSMVEDAYIKKLIVYGELRSDEVTLGYNTSLDELKKINEANILPTNSYSNWSDFYEIINYCNIILHYAPQAQANDPNFSVAKLNAKMAEVLAIRALNYFYLVRVFGQVPYITTASLSEGQDYEVPKSNEDVILDGMEADLVKAEGWAMSSYGSVESNKGRFTKNGIRALLADVYLWRGKYDDCIATCDKILNDKTISLIPAEDEPYRTIFGEKNSKESIFELQFDAANYTYNGSVNSFYGTKGTESGYLTASTVLENEELFPILPETDVRKRDFMSSAKMNGININNIFKYGGLYRIENLDGITSRYFYRDPNSSPANWIMYRLPDVMLMKAEALVQNGNYLPALKLVNTTYMRSHPTFAYSDTLKASNYTLKSEMEELVLKERQRELMFEGKRWFDLMRMARRDSSSNRLLVKVLAKYSDNLGEVGSKLKDMNGLYFPINESELNSNSKLVQNPYYDKEY